MLSKAQNKHIRSLTQQKFRDEYRLFTAEGHKVALEWLNSNWHIKTIIVTEKWATDNSISIKKHPEAELHIVKEGEIAVLSSMHAQSQVFLVVDMPSPKEVPVSAEWYLALDEIQDPGNMGTIIRIADWFGIKHIICAPGCVDIYNPKVVQSAMGGHLRVNIYHKELTEILPALKLPIYAATLDGQNVYDAGRHDVGVLVIGNESKGVSAKVSALANRKVTIPGKGGAESLNAGVSAGILCALLLPR
jgi:TrmH family RNA methyltransferase